MLPNTCPLGKLLVESSRRGLERPTISPRVRSPTNATRPTIPPTIAKAIDARVSPISQRNPTPAIPIAMAGRLLVRALITVTKPASNGASRPTTQASTVRSWEGTAPSLMAMVRRTNGTVNTAATSSQSRTRGLITARIPVIRPIMSALSSVTISSPALRLFSTLGICAQTRKTICRTSFSTVPYQDSAPAETTARLFDHREPLPRGERQYDGSQNRRGSTTQTSSSLGHRGNTPVPGFSNRMSRIPG